MVTGFETWLHVPCQTELKIAWPESPNRDDLVTDRMEYLAEEVQLLYCPACGDAWRTDDPVFREARRISRRESARWNREAAQRRREVEWEMMKERQKAGNHRKL